MSVSSRKKGKSMSDNQLECVIGVDTADPRWWVEVIEAWGGELVLVPCSGAVFSPLTPGGDVLA
jgi:hypothetical protein